MSISQDELAQMRIDREAWSRPWFRLALVFVVTAALGYVAVFLYAMWGFAQMDW